MKLSVYFITYPVSPLKNGIFDPQLATRWLFNRQSTIDNPKSLHPLPILEGVHNRRRNEYQQFSLFNFLVLCLEQPA